MKIKVEDVKYFGYKQGVKVYIDGVKYPRQRGYVYAEYENNKIAIKQAIEDKNMVEEYMDKNNF